MNPETPTPGQGKLADLTVTVRDRASEAPWGSGPVTPVTRTVTISGWCPVCGGPRGEPQGLNSCDDGAYYWVQVWTNPCGHLDRYEAVLAEAAGLAGADRREAEPTAEDVERSETTGAVPYPSMDEDLKGPKNIDGYGNEEEDAEGGGRSHGATCGTTGPDGRFIAGDEAARFWAKVEISPDRPDDCWLWTGGRTRDGYGRFRVIRDGRPTHVRAHRWAYEAKVGPTHGLPLDHRCRTRSCVNPDHLEAVSTRENARRVHQPGPVVENHDWCGEWHQQPADGDAASEAHTAKGNP